MTEESNSSIPIGQKYTDVGTSITHPTLRALLLDDRPLMAKKVEMPTFDETNPMGWIAICKS